MWVLTTPFSVELCLYLHHPQVQSGWEVVVRLLDTCFFQAVVPGIYPHHIGTPYRHWNNKMKEDYQLLVMSRHEYLGRRPMFWENWSTMDRSKILSISSSFRKASLSSMVPSCCTAFKL